MAKSLDHVLQPDGTYKWEEVEPEVSPAPKETKKKTTKKKTTSPLSD